MERPGASRDDAVRMQIQKDPDTYFREARAAARKDAERQIKSELARGSRTGQTRVLRKSA